MFELADYGNSRYISMGDDMILSKYDLDELKNYSESIVVAELERQLENISDPACLCTDCVLDMAALALNTVKPMYRASLLGSLYTASAMDEETFASSVKDAVSSAIEKVCKNPSHEIGHE